MLRVSVVIAFCVCAAPATLYGEVYGVKTHDPVSGPPTHLYVFAEDGSSFADLGEIKVNGASVDVDALAIAATGELYAYQVLGPDSQLIRVDPATLIGTPIGEPLYGREIRGAVFDLPGHLWLLDSANDQILSVYEDTGQPTGILPAALTVDSAPYNLSTTCDLAVRSDGRVTLCDFSQVYAVEPTSGRMDFRGTISGLAIAGLTYSADADCPLELFGYEINNSDDIYSIIEYEAYAASLLYQNIVPQYNAGRGDLAALPALTGIPCPGDLDDDWDTDQADLGVLLAAYNQDAAGDLDGDGDTDQADLGALLADYGCTPCD